MKNILFNSPLRSERYIKNVKKLLDSGNSLHGPGKNILNIKKDLKKKFGFNHVHLTTSCTASMEICALTLNLKKNDEVLIPSYGYNTSASSFVRTGCKIKYCDIDQTKLMPSFEQIKKEINKKTKVIIIFHMQGLAIEYLDKLQKYCKSKKIYLIEDAAQALGSYHKDKPLGSYGDFACFSFHETKNFHSGMGGLLVINNKKLIRKSDLVFDKGTDRTLVVSNPNYYKKYYSWVEIGSCFRMPELNASYLTLQIRDIEKLINHRSSIYKRYIRNLSKWLNDEFQICNRPIYKYNYHQFTIILKKREREKFLKFLKKNKIIAFIGLEALHLSKVGRNFLNKNTNLNNTDNIIKKIVRLPIHNNLKLKDVDIICSKIKEYFEVN